MSDAETIARCVVEKGVSHMAAAGCAARAGSGWRRESGGDVEAFFDLASVTKPMTAVAIARAGLDRSAPLESFLPELRGTRSAKLPLELLLAHRAGLEAHVALFEPLTRGEPFDPARALVTVADSRREDATGEPAPDGFAPVYSDLGYALAGAALARAVSAEDAGDAIVTVVVRPLGLEGSLGTARTLEAHGVDLASRAAPTEVVAWRGGAVVGRVHDENAWALTGAGGSGHAGMFGTVDAVLTFGCALLDALDGLPSPLGADLAWLVRERGGGTLRAGFDGKSAEASSAGTVCGARSFGHLGFTGTSLWIDPDAARIVALLTNRVHPTRENLAIRVARPGAHDALFARAGELHGPKSFVK